MSISKKTLPFLVSFFFIFAFFEGAIVPLQANAIDLPKTSPQNGGALGQV
jgi:hypothetical protein